MVYLDLLYISLLMIKQQVKSGPTADCLGCSISIQAASQPCGCIIANIAETVRV